MEFGGIHIGFVILSLLYAAMAFLALGLLIRTRLGARWKTLFIVVFTGLAILSHRAWQGMAGWPTEAPLPPRFLYHAATVREPNPNKNDPGQLQVWATELLPGGPAPEPRAYILPYSKEDHREIQAARGRISRSGLPQVGRLVRGRDGNGRLVGGKQAANSASFQLGDLPDPALPEK